LPDEDATVYDIDIVMSHDGSRAFGYDFNRISPKPRWSLDPTVKAEVQEAAKRLFLKDNGKKLAGRLGKIATPPEWKSMLSSGANSAEEASLADIEDLN
jgi:hypothetical protein